MEVFLETHYGKGRVKFPATVLDYLVSPPALVRTEYMVLAGHITYDVALPYMDDAILVTLFRNPVARIRSAYNYFRCLNDDSEISRVSSSLAFKEWLDSNIPCVSVLIQNAMIRQFTPESYWDYTRPACPELIQEQACRFLSTFHLVGLTEQYDIFHRKLCGLIGAQMPMPPRRENASLVDATQDVHDDYILNWMIENSYLDVFFYKYIVNKYKVTKGSTIRQVAIGG